jgi:arginine-tRNA-protein transferase
MQRFTSLPILTDRDPPEIVVYDRTERCPYLPAERARLPMRLPLRWLDGNALDERFAHGDRRHGALLYRPTCPSCRACEAIRIDANEYRPNATQRRLLRRNEGVVRIERGDPVADEARVALYDAHKRGRGLSTSAERPMTVEAYRQFLVDRCCEAFETRFFVGDRLVGVSITDRSATALSAVYCYYDPSLVSLGLGTYSILKQLEQCRTEGRRYLYLGLFVVGNRAMAYKARFLPHERRLDGAWTRFERA